MFQICSLHFTHSREHWMLSGAHYPNHVLFFLKKSQNQPHSSSGKEKKQHSGLFSTIFISLVCLKGRTRTFPCRSTLMFIYSFMLPALWLSSCGALFSHSAAWCSEVSGWEASNCSISELLNMCLENTIQRKW